jgi:hypothetical protein
VADLKEARRQAGNAHSKLCKLNNETVESTPEYVFSIVQNLRRCLSALDVTGIESLQIMQYVDESKDTGQDRAREGG